MDWIKSFHSGTSRPIWRLDSQVATCQSCTTEFNIFVRRHHCRNCGGVYCAECTQSRQRLSFLGYHTPVRVCDSCNRHLSFADMEEGVIGETWDNLVQKLRDGTIARTSLVPKVNQGVPDSIRKKLWLSLLIYPSRQKYAGIYQTLINGESIHQEKINADVTRTYPESNYFQTEEGQTSLTNILNAYSQFKPNVGYRQGMSFIGAVCLYVLTEEEEAFWMMAAIMETLLTQDQVSEGLEYVAEKLKEVSPALCEHFESNNVTVDIFIHRWLNTLFAYDMTLNVVIQVWDVLFTRGKSFGWGLSLSILSSVTTHLLELQAHEMIKYFNDVAPELISKAPKSYFKNALDYIEGCTM